MSEVIVLVTFVAHPEMQDEAEAFLTDLLGPTHGEPGC
jgi:quinol monooxygenase YgiN